MYCEHEPKAPIKTVNQGTSLPKISVIIICYNMQREVPRTVQSFLPPYQSGFDKGDIEVIVLENGSTEPIPEEVISAWGSDVRYISVPNPSSSPAKALNLGVRMARAPVVCPVIDGARMASPGILAFGLKALNDHPGSFVTTVGFHLGPEPQQISARSGYDQCAEDQLLAEIEWPASGYRLFEIAAVAGSAQEAWFGRVAESNAPILTKDTYDKIGGFDPAFDFPGGGLVNLDFFNRAMEDSSIPHVMVLGEGTFHQFHGGTTTSAKTSDEEEGEQTTWARYTAQYQTIRGKPFAVIENPPVFYGALGPEALKFCLGIFRKASS